MQTILYQSDIISKYRENLGISMAFENIIYLHNVRKKSNPNDREKEMFKYLDTLISFEGFEGNPIVSKKENRSVNVLGEYLLETFQQTLPSFKEQDTFLGQVTLKQLGIIDIYDCPNFIMYDLFVDNPKEIGQEILNNHVLFLQTYTKQEYIRETLWVDYKFDRIQLYITTNNYNYSDLLTFYNLKLSLQPQAYYLSLGKNYLSHQKIISTEKLINLSIKGTKFSGKTLMLKQLLISLKILNSNKPLEIILFNSKEDKPLEHLSDISYTDVLQYVSITSNLIKDIRNRQNELMELNMETFSEAHENIKYNKPLKVIVFEDLDLIIKKMYQVSEESGKAFEDNLTTLSMIGRSAGFQLLVTYSLNNLPKNLLANTNVNMFSNSLSDSLIKDSEKSNYFNCFSQGFFYNVNNNTNNIYNIFPSDFCTTDYLIGTNSGGKP